MEDAERGIGPEGPSKKESFSLLPPTLGFLPQRNNFQGFLKGIGNPARNHFGLRGKSKDSGDIRNYSSFEAFESKKEPIRHKHLGQNPKMLGGDDAQASSNESEDKLGGWGEDDERWLSLVTNISVKSLHQKF